MITCEFCHSERLYISLEPYPEYSCLDCGLIGLVPIPIKTITRLSGAVDLFSNFKINIRDIAAGLSNTCRYNGQVSQFYSVAEHCCHVYDLTGDIWALLHDAAEAYIGDMVPQIRAIAPIISVLEDRILQAIVNQLNTEYQVSIPQDMPDKIHAVDIAIRYNELWHLCDYDNGANPVPGVQIQCWSPAIAYANYMERLNHALSALQETDHNIQDTPS